MISAVSGASRTYPQPPLPKAVAPAAAAPTDTVSLQPSATARGANPWPPLERAGLLGAANAVGGPIGNSLDAATRQGLLDACTRLQAAGWAFEEQRSFHVPLMRSKYVPLSPEQMVDAVAQEPARFKSRLNVSGHGQQHLPLRDLEALRQLDSWYGIGDTAGGDRLPAVRAFRSLDQAGWKFEARDPDAVYYYTMKGAYNAFNAVNERHGATATPPTKGLGQSTVQSDEEVVALDFFAGSGQDHGLHQPEVAARLKHLDSRGYRFNFGYENDCDAKNAYSTMNGRYSRQLRVGHKGGVSLAVDNLAACDMDKLEKRIDQAEKIYERIGKPALQAVGVNGGADAFADAVTAEDPKFSCELRAAVLGELIRAGDGRYDGRNYMGQATEDMRHLCGLSANPSELATNTNLFGTLMRAEGRNSAYGFKKAMADGLRSRTASEAEYQRLQPVLVELISATGSTRAALEGVDLIRIPLGSETEDQRLSLFKNIADRESESTLCNTASDYRAVLVHRLPTEGLVEAGQRFCNILEALSLKRQQDRAAEVFAVIQGGVREGRFGKMTADAVVEQFSHNFVMSKSVDDALHAVNGGRGLPGPATVESGDDCVVIGGIRVPKQG